MPKYGIYFNQQWVGDHSEEWFAGRGPLARAVVEEMRVAGVLLFAGGLEEEIDEARGFYPNGSEVEVAGPVAPRDQFLGGLTIIEVPDEEQAKMWASKIAVACGWPQEMRTFK